jgi:cation:H+ antiporter
MIAFATLPLWLNIATFLAAAVAVWIAGTRLSRYADGIAREFGIGQAVLGVVLLGGVTSLPEIAVTGTAAFGGNAELAVNNLLGGFAMQVAILALADMAIRKSALTATVPDPIILLQGILGIILVTVTIAGISVGDIAFAGAGLWTWALAVLFVYAVRMVVRAEDNPGWKVIGEPPSPEIDAEDPKHDLSRIHLLAATGMAALGILVMGYLLSTSGEALAERSGLGDSFFGAVFIAISTSLPEISTVLAAVKLGRYVMAVSDIFGTNLFDIGVIFLVDLFFPGGAVLNEVGTFSIVAGLIGITVTAVYVVGLIERRDPALFGIGFDSYAVAVIYLGGVFLLFTMR